MSKTKLSWGDYASVFETATIEEGGVYKTFSQDALLAAYMSLGPVENVKRGVCRALSAAYLARQYTVISLKSEDGKYDEIQMKQAMLEDPKRVLASVGSFFSNFGQGLITANERATNFNPKHRVKLEVGFGSGFWLDTGKLEYDQKNGAFPSRQHVSTDEWKVQRMEQVAEVQHATAKRVDIFSPSQMEDQMTKTMEYFSSNMTSTCSGKIKLEGDYTDQLWGNHQTGYYLCFVPTHAFALVVRTDTSWKGGYHVKFFDSNFGQSKFRELENFKEFLRKIAGKFNSHYSQKHMDYHMFE